MRFRRMRDASGRRRPDVLDHYSLFISLMGILSSTIVYLLSTIVYLSIGVPGVWISLLTEVKAARSDRYC